jgi:gamma-glutamyltranspeptidase / glutathione hydrolase
LPPFKSGLVVSANCLASEAGAKVLKNGGNAVDAAITTAHVLGVSAPAFSGIGGGGFALVWRAREEKAVFIDFREKAPLAAKEDMFKFTPSGKVLRQENAIGYKSVAVPGTISGHALMLENYGTLRLSETLHQAERTAKYGFRVGRALGFSWKLSAGKLRRFAESRSTYLNRGRTYNEGDLVTLPSLARTIQKIAAEGADEFYQGSVARMIVHDMAENNGLIASRDLEDYEPTIREPIRGSYNDYEIISAPPPSAGGAIMLQSLNILANLPVTQYARTSAVGIHILAEALARGFMNCRATISDPAFSDPRTEMQISRTLARELASTVSTRVSSIPTEPREFPLMPASNTTHLVAIDAEHNVVSLTESVECYFGSGITVPGTGLVLNDTMHDFDPHRQTVNSVAPGKIPMSSMSPTVVLKEGRPILALGGAGGPRIVSSTFEVLLNVVEYGLELRDAVAAPRIHINGTRVQLEEPLRPVANELRKIGHSVEVRKRVGKGDPGLYFGGVQAAQIREDNSLVGAPDPRRDGLAVGLR